MLWEDGIGSRERWEAGKLTDDNLEETASLDEGQYFSEPWPMYLLPLCEHGCKITNYFYADTEQVVQGIHGDDKVVAASFEEGLKRWLAGEELQLI